MKILAAVLLIPFLALTGFAVMDAGYIGIFDYQRHSPAGWQVMADLVIALILVMVWMVRDARSNARRALPWLALTLFGGSIGPLLYLLFAPAREGDETGGKT